MINKRIELAQIIKEKDLHRLRRENDKEKQKIIKEAKTKHDTENVQNDLNRENDMIKNQVSLLLSNSR